MARFQIILPLIRGGVIFDKKYYFLTNLGLSLCD